jgi:hypothetical protein
MIDNTKYSSDQLKMMSAYMTEGVTKAIVAQETEALESKSLEELKNDYRTLHN